VKLRTCSVFLNDEEWTAHFTYHPATSGSWYKRNGDPGDPPEPDELEVEKLTRGNSTIEYRDLCEEEYAAIEQQCIDAAIQEDREEIESYYERHEL